MSARLLTAACMTAVCLSAAALAQRPAEVVQGVAFQQRLGAEVPLELAFRDQTGRDVKLRELVGERPIILSLVYYQCPRLCTLELNGLVTALAAIQLAPGRDYEIVTVSFDPSDTTERAAAKRQAYLRQFPRAGADAAWHFLTGEKAAIDALCQSVGFQYVYDESTRQYAHASGLVVLTPQGRVSRYFFGFDYPAGDLRLGLVEASGGKIGSATDQLLLLCYGYDPATGKYGLLIMNIIRVLGGITVVVLSGFVGTSIWRERSLAAGQPTPGTEHEMPHSHPVHGNEPVP